MGELLQPFLAALSGDRERLGDLTEEALAARVDQARRAWPALHVDAACFVAHVASKLGPEQASLDALHLDDLYLAFGCAQKDPAALREFERAVVPKLARRGERPLSDETLQQLRERLFALGKIAEYSGRGRFHSWVRMVALRLDLNAPAQPRRETELTEGTAAVLMEKDPELKVAHAEAQAILKDALTAAFEQLEAKQRRLLRLFHVDGVPHAKIGLLFDAPRSTVAFWLQQARARLLELVERHLAEQIRIERNDLQSWLNLARSELDITLSRVLPRSNAKK